MEKISFFVSALVSVFSIDRECFVFPPLIHLEFKKTSPSKLTSRILKPRAWPRDEKIDGKELEQAAAGGAIRFNDVEGGIEMFEAKLAAAAADAAAAAVVPVESSLVVASLQQSFERALPRAAIVAASSFPRSEKGKKRAKRVENKKKTKILFFFHSFLFCLSSFAFLRSRRNCGARGAAQRFEGLDDFTLSTSRGLEKDHTKDHTSSSPVRERA